MNVQSQSIYTFNIVIKKLISGKKIMMIDVAMT